LPHPGVGDRIELEPLPVQGVEIRARHRFVAGVAGLVHAALEAIVAVRRLRRVLRSRVARRMFRLVSVTAREVDRRTRVARVVLA
jgi:hypothetical protein